MRRLVIVRHAKSSWKEPFAADFDRPLSGRGKREAPAMGERLSALGVKPDLVVTSPAKRARKTAAVVAGALGCRKKEIVSEPAIYEAGVETLLSVIRGLDDDAGEVLIFGHNPGFTDLANALVSEGGVESIPTCGALGLEFDVRSWREVRRRGGKVLFYEVPTKEGPAEG